MTREIPAGRALRTKHTFTRDPRTKTIREQLAKLLAHELFEPSERQSRFLAFVVEKELAGHGERVNQYTLAFEVFDRDATFDPLEDSIVRVEARRLRSKLTEYYAGTGRDDSIVITVPKGRYRALIEVGEGAAVETALRSEPRRSSAKPGVAVLPFDNFSGDPEQEYFSDGITEDIITDLSKISGLAVISRHSTFVYKGRRTQTREISEDLGARYIVEGSVRKANGRVRITAQLIDAAVDDHLWAERYDRGEGDIFAIQDDVSRQIVAALELRLTGLEKERLGHHGTENTEAHDLYLRAQEQFYQFGPGCLERAEGLLQQSLEIDPGFASAHAWRSRVLVLLLLTGIKTSREETLVPALAAACRAVELDSLLPLAHASLGWVRMWNREIDGAVEAAERSLELDANFADAHMWHALILASSGRGEDALAAIERAVGLNPFYTVTHLMALGLAFFTLGRYEDAREHFERGIRRNSSFIFNHVFRVSALGLLGREREAREAGDRLREFPQYRRAVAEGFFFNDDAMFHRFTEGLNRAGIE